MPLDCTGDSPWLTNNSPPSAPSPALSPSSTTQTSGSSFKPLHLSSHPWVRAQEPIDPDKPRLSFLALHCHMYGPDSFSESNMKPDVSATTTTPRPTLAPRGSPDSLFETAVSPVVSNSARLLAGRATESPSARASPSNSSSQATAYSRHSTTGTMTLVPISVLPPFPREPIHCRVANIAPAANVSGSAEPAQASLLAPPTTSQSSPSKPKKRRQKRTNVAPLSVAAFPTAFSLLSPSDKFFGYPEPKENLENKRTRKDLDVTDDWVNQEVNKAHRKRAVKGRND